MKISSFHVFIAGALITVVAGLNASGNAYEGRAVYHSQCQVSTNPVQYQGHSGKISVRRWWYLDTVTQERIAARKAQHEACESVKVLMSTPEEVAEAERLQEVADNWLTASFAWMVGFFLFTWLLSKYQDWKNERELEEIKREAWAEYRRCEEERAIREKTLKADRIRSKRANEERARRKAERGAILEARRLANLERKAQG